MREETPQNPSEPETDRQQRRTTDRGTDVGTSEPGMPPRTDADKSVRGAPTEDSPAREPTERVERMEDAEDARSV